MQETGKKRFLFRWSSFALFISGAILFSLLSGPEVSAQQIQIPSIQVCNKSQVYGKAVAQNMRRKPPTFSGTLELEIKVSCVPATTNGYPVGIIRFRNIQLNDSEVTPYLEATSIEQVSSVGQTAPMIYLRGRCKAETKEKPIDGCRYWLMVADNKKEAERGTPDIISLVVLDKMGTRRIYFTGTVVKGDLVVSSGI